MILGMQLLYRFIIGGLVIALFATAGDLLRPKSFAGIFGAAPALALATLGLAILERGSIYAATEARSMMVGAAAFVLYACVSSRLLRGGTRAASSVTIANLGLWILFAFFGWLLVLRVPM
jgi:hypothetical protein